MGASIVGQERHRRERVGQKAADGQQATGNRQQATGHGQQATADSRQQTADSRQQTTDSSDGLPQVVGCWLWAVRLFGWPSGVELPSR